MPIILEASGLVKRYPGVVAVDGVDLAVSEGTCFGMLGPNGAGKTTTVEILEGINKPDAGTIRYRGEPRDDRYREAIGIQFQTSALQDFLTVRETLVMFSRLYKRQLDLDDVIETCALGELIDRDNRKLSGGQRQRLLLAIALVNDPDLLFLDEPTTGLDPQARRAFWRLVDNIKALNKTIILTTHYMEEAYILCDEIVIMDRGRVIAEGTPDDLLKAHYQDVILELPGADADGRLEEDFPLGLLSERGVSLNRLRIRPRTLEDLFLELTGRELRA